MSEGTFDVGPWKRPGTASRAVTAIETIARKAVSDAVTYRMAKVVELSIGSLTVEFADEPGNPVVIEGLPAIRPRRVGQNVEIEVRDGTQFMLARVFGAFVMLDPTTLDSTEPDVPTGLRVDSAARAVTVSWDVTPRAVSYDVDMAKDANFTTEQSVRTVNSNQLIISNLTGGDGWFYRVRSANTAGDSDWSSPVSVVVDGSGGFTVKPGNPPEIRLTGVERGILAEWDAITDAERYEVQFSKDSNLASGIGVHTVQTNSWLRTGLTLGDTWYKRVRAINQAGASDWSPIASATVSTDREAPAGKPVKVIGVAHSTSNRAVTTVWSPQRVADYFEVERSPNAGFTEVTVLQQVQGSTLTEQNLIAGQKWYYRIRGINDAGVGDWSDVTDVTVLSDIPEPGSPDKVLNLRLSSIPSQINAKWDSLEGTGTYEVQRSLDPTFNGGIVSEMVESNETTTTKLKSAETWHYRVRGTSGDLRGTWSDVVSQIVMLSSEYTDGKPPDNSPPVTVRPGIQQLIASWPIQPNEDPVIYEVHLGLQSGFLPTAQTLLGETSGTFWVTNNKPDGTKLQPGTTHFIRVVAKDADGKSDPGQQGSGIPDVIDLGAAGDVQYGSIVGDGFVPGTPSAPSLTSGLGYIYARWPSVASPDPVTYEVHVHTSASFIPDANSLSLVTTSLFGFLRVQGPGQERKALVYGTSYFVRLIARDVDGVSQPGPPAEGFTVKANTADIAVDAITAQSGIIADLAVETAKIAALAVTTAKIGDLQVSTGKIGELAVTNAKIGDLAVTNAKIQDLAVTTGKIGNLAVTDLKVGSVGAGKITTDVLYAQLTVAGVIKTSASGRRVEMNSGGLFMYDDFGAAVVSLNASSGTASFRGNIFAVNGTFTGNISSSATITGGTFNGGLFKSSRSTAGSGNYIEMGNTGISDPVDEIRFFYGFGNVSSIRNPSSNPGSMVFSLSNGVTWHMTPNAGLRSQSSITINGSFDSNTIIRDRGNPVYSAINPQAISQNNQIFGAYANSGPIFLRGFNDYNHRLQYGIGGRDGPDLMGFNTAGLMCANFSSTLTVIRAADSGNAFVARTLFQGSAENIKQDIQAIEVPMADRIKQLNPVTYRRKPTPIQAQRKSFGLESPGTDNEVFGFIAEEVAQIWPELVGYNPDGSIFGLAYGEFSVPIIKTLQEVLARLEALETPGKPPVGPVTPPTPTPIKP